MMRMKMMSIMNSWILNYEHYEFMNYDVAVNVDVDVVDDDDEGDDHDDDDDDDDMTLWRWILLILYDSLLRFV